ncbi:MAG: hypothetical protein V7730_15950, partial [Sulfitobacter sp.]
AGQISVKIPGQFSVTFNSVELALDGAKARPIRMARHKIDTGILGWQAALYCPILEQPNLVVRLALQCVVL